MSVRPDVDGWAYATSNGKGKIHYYRNGRTLCGRYTRALTQPSRSGSPEEFTCKGCFQKANA